MPNGYEYINNRVTIKHPRSSLSRCTSIHGGLTYYTFKLAIVCGHKTSCILPSEAGLICKRGHHLQEAGQTTMRLMYYAGPTTGVHHDDFTVIGKHRCSDQVMDQ